MSTYTVIYKNKLSCKRDTVVFEADDKDGAIVQWQGMFLGTDEQVKDYMIIKVIKGTK